MFVGVGASRRARPVRAGKAEQPVHHLCRRDDAVGRQRGAGFGGGHDEREQTLNQLLVEMDGFGDRSGIILIAATNRPTSSTWRSCVRAASDRQIPVSNPTCVAARPS